MGRAFIPALSLVDLHCALCIDRKPLVRINGNAKEPRVGVDQLVLVSHHRIPEYTGIIEVGQACHVVTAVKLGWVDLTYLVFLEDFGLKNMKGSKCFALLNTK